MQDTLVKILIVCLSWLALTLAVKFDLKFQISLCLVCPPELIYRVNTKIISDKNLFREFVLFSEAKLMGECTLLQCIHYLVLYTDLGSQGVSVFSMALVENVFLGLDAFHGKCINFSTKLFLYNKYKN